MARKCKCQICNAILTTDKAYKVAYINNKGKTINKYYCDSIEYEQFEEEKDYKKKILELVNEILGYVCVNSVIFKELENIHKGYTFKEITYCFENEKDNILHLLNINGIDKEFNKIRYMFAVISRSIADTTREMQNKINNKELNKKKLEDVEKEEYIPFSDYSFKESETTDFSSLF